MRDRCNPIRLDGKTISLVFAQADDGHVLLSYFGPLLPDNEDLDALAKSSLFGHHESQPDIPQPISLLPESKFGYDGSPALELRSGEVKIRTDFRLQEIETSSGVARFVWSDKKNPLQLQSEWRIGKSDLITSRVTLRNEGSEPIGVDWVASLNLPVPGYFDEATHYSGRWAGEMRSQTMPLAREKIEKMSTGGRPGFGGGNWLRLGSIGGQAKLGCHFCWSGDYRAIVEQNSDGPTMVLMGPRLEAGEIVLNPGANFTPPDAIFGWAATDNLLSQAFHHHLRSEILPDRANWAERKVHINSWEALGFDLDEDRLKTLADHAAALGIERFILDDGWFEGRRDATTSLGDWTVDEGLFANGLNPLIDHVHDLGMDFGLWIEPEMVSPDSKLFRAHPDWCLHVVDMERRTQRGQLALDLTRPAVGDYIFDSVNKLLRENQISYLKWDHNRELFPAANPRGPAGIAQVKALYKLLDRLRDAHPKVEIESCASGGGRVDYEILRRCHRMWASDNNDAIERLRINKSWTGFLPLEVLGNHVGPSPNPVTGRQLSMDFRAKVAMFGHMGVEADPAQMSDEEREILAAHIALYKNWREVLHGGDHFNIDHPSTTIFGQMVCGPQRALALVAQSGFESDYNAAPVRLPGLSGDELYRVTLLKPWPRKASGYLNDPAIWEEGITLSGTLLAEGGLSLPLSHPETAWLIALEKTE